MTANDRQFYLMVGALMTTDFIAALEVSMIFGALPAVNRIYGDPGSVGWLITSFVLVQAASAAIGGRLGDIFGRRKLLELVLLTSAAGSLLSALSDDLLWIIVGRGLQGVSGAILPLSFAIIRSHSPEARAKLGVGLVLGAYSASAGLGFILGGYLADIGHWHWMFYITAALPSTVILLNRAALPRDPIAGQTSQAIDYIGVVGLVASVAAVMLGITLSRSLGWTSHVTLGLLGAGVAGATLWARYELSHEAPLINLRWLRNPRFLFAILIFLFIGIGGQQTALITLSIMQQPVWTGVGLGLTGAIAGFAKLPSNMAGVAAGPIGGRIAQTWGGRVTAIVGALVLVAAWATLYLSHSSLLIVIGCAAGSTVGLTILYVATPAILMEAVPAEDTGQATGFAFLVRALGMAVGAQMVSLLLGAAQVREPAGGQVYSAPIAFEWAIGFVAMASLIVLACAFLVPRHTSPRPDGVADLS